MIHTLFVIHSWKQSQEIQSNVLRLVPKSPVISCEWYKEQGMIEWHDAKHSQWKKRIQKHMQEKRSHTLMDSSAILYFVIWNAQVVPESYWNLWKDLPGHIVAICVSTQMIPRLRQLGFRVKQYPTIPKVFPSVRVIMQEFVHTSEWKRIVDFRLRLMDYLEWNESLYDLRSFLSNEAMQILASNSCLDRDSIGRMERDIFIPLSNTVDPIQFVFLSERLLILLLRIVKQRQSRQ